MIQAYVEQTPLWLLFSITVLLLVVSVEIGFRFGWHRSHRPDFDDESHVNTTTGAQLALMGFILAFTFSQAADHHTVRRQLMLEQLVSIEAAYLRAGLIDQQPRRVIREALSEYVDLAAASYDQDEHAAVLQRAEVLRLDIWKQVAGLSRNGNEIGEAETLLVDSVNRVFEIHERRVTAGLHTRIPNSIWVMLYVILILSMFATGYFSGIKGKRSLTTTWAMTISLALILWLIADLERPQSGFLITDRSKLQEFSDRLREATPSRN